MEKGSDRGGEERLEVRERLPLSSATILRSLLLPQTQESPVVGIGFNVKPESFLNRSSLLQFNCLIIGEFNLLV